MPPEFTTVTAPQLNVNDTEMLVAAWHVTAWGRVEEGQEICDIESTKAAISIQSPCAGYLWPLAAEKSVVAVGAPLALIFPSANPDQLLELDSGPASIEAVVVSNKARALMAEKGLTLADFPRFTAIDHATVVALLRERDATRQTASPPVFATVDSLFPEGCAATDIAIWGEANQALMALDILVTHAKLHPVAYVSDVTTAPFYYGVPVVRSCQIEDLIARGLGRVFVCGGTATETETIVARAAGLALESVIHPSAVISPFAKLAKGLYIGPQAVIGPDVVLEDFVRILSGATVAHHSRIGRHAVITDGAVLGGNVVVGEHALIGIGARVNKRIEIGRDAVVVSGATVTRDVPADHVVRLDQTIAPRPRC